eukprot:4766054-Amphidinium_carterae.1
MSRGKSSLQVPFRVHTFFPLLVTILDAVRCFNCSFAVGGYPLPSGHGVKLSTVDRFPASSARHY